VILCGFGVIVGVATTRQLESQFEREVADAADELQRELRLRPMPDGSLRPVGVNIEDFARGDQAAIRILYQNGELI